MEYTSRYLGKIYDGTWKVVHYERTESKNYCYILENQFNNNRYAVGAKTMSKLDRGETTMSSIIHTSIKLKIDRRLKKWLH